MNHQTTFKMYAAATMLLAAPAMLCAATIPYAENFNGQVTGAAAPIDNASASWIENANANWNIITGGLGGAGSASDKAYRFVNNNSATNNAMTTSSIDSVTLAANTSFAVSTSFSVLSNTTISSNSANGELRVGLVALGNSLLASAYLGDVVIRTTSGGAEAGLLRLTRLGGSVSQTGSGLTINTTDTYSLALSGDYSGSSLTLTLTLTNLTTQDTASISTVDSAPLIGGAAQNYFGYRNRNFSGSSTNASSTSASMNVDYDNFAVTTPAPVPEPAMIGTLGLGMLALLCSGKRRR